MTEHDPYNFIKEANESGARLKAYLDTLDDDEFVEHIDKLVAICGKCIYVCKYKYAKHAKEQCDKLHVGPSCYVLWKYSPQNRMTRDKVNEVINQT